MSAIFGGSKSKSNQQSSSTNTSYNRAYDWARSRYDPVTRTGNQATSSIAALLGLGGDRAAADRAYDDYLGSTGYTDTLDTGSRAITTNAASRGLLGSGATLKRLTEFGQDTAQQYFQNYLERLLGLVNNGLQAGNLIVGSGNYSKGSSQSTGSSSSSSTGGLAALIGSAAAGAPKG